MQNISEEDELPPKYINKLKNGISTNSQKKKCTSPIIIKQFCSFLTICDCLYY